MIVDLNSSFGIKVLLDAIPIATVGLHASITYDPDIVEIRTGIQPINPGTFDDFSFQDLPGNFIFECTSSLPIVIAGDALTIPFRAIAVGTTDIVFEAEPPIGHIKIQDALEGDPASNKVTVTVQ